MLFRLTRFDIIVFVLLLTFSNNLFAQPQLALLKNDHIITRFEEGEYIRFQRKGDESFISAIIVGIHPGYFLVGQDTIWTYDVAKVDVRKKTLTNFKLAPIGKGLMIAGASLFAIHIFNTIVIRNNDLSIDDAVIRGGSILIGTGGIMQIFNNNYFNPGRKRKIATLNL